MFSSYEETRGDVVETVRGMLAEAQGSLPDVPRPGDDASTLPFVAHAVATGYGEDVLRAPMRLAKGAPSRPARESHPAKGTPSSRSGSLCP